MNLLKNVEGVAENLEDCTNAADENPTKKRAKKKIKKYSLARKEKRKNKKYFLKTGFRLKGLVRDLSMSSKVMNIKFIDYYFPRD